MDILDIILAKAMTPQGQISTYAARAEQAVQQATQVLNNIQSITEQTNANNEASELALQQVQQALQNLDTVGNLQDIADTEIEKLVLSITSNNESNYTANNLLVQYPNESTAQLIGTCAKYYTTTGQNTDGTMTQKAITDAINNIEIETINFGVQNANKILIVGANGQMVPSNTITEQNLINGVTPSGGGQGGDSPSQPVYTNTGVVGIRINYTTSIITPTDDSITATAEDYNNYNMYGGRKKCLVSDDGTIQAFYGDNNYTDNPENGYQVMVYQPKFYYKHSTYNTYNSQAGKTIREHGIQLSDSPKQGFTIHPLFLDEEGNELEYVLLSAYEGSIDSTSQDSYKDIKYNDFLTEKLSSVSNAKPISGQNNTLTVTIAQKLASNRGPGWHILTSKVISAQQMLQMVEFGTLNMQTGFHKGICEMQSGANENKGAITGSTKELGNNSGQALETNFISNNEEAVETEEGKVAIAYRGYENPWGNMWQLIGDIIVKNNGNIHTPYICNNYYYDDDGQGDYEQLEVNVAPSSGWIFGFGYNANNNWLLMPSVTGSTASSLLPVGDYFFTSASSSGNQCLVNGGPWFGGSNVGPFYYTFDRRLANNVGYNVNARLMYIPQINTPIYTANINKWNTSRRG